MELKTGAIVALSWPDTKIRNASSWYDGLMSIMGICKDGYYSVGHAALLLIDYRTGKIRYFDFGRYHTPFGYGRVRDEQSDPELTINTRAEVVEGNIINIKDILLELQDNRSTHGDGKVVCSITDGIDYDLAIASSKSIHGRGAVPYGPFQFTGSNCSRFVARIYKAGFTSYLKKRRISNWYLYFHTPTSNIIFTHTRENVFIVEQGEFRVEESMMDIYKNTSKVSKETKIEKTPKKIKLPESVFCLSGTGGDTYFQLDKTNKNHLFRVRRYSEYGELEIDDIFQLQNIGFDINKPYGFDYISNGIEVKIKQDKKVFVLKNIKYQNRKPVLPNKSIKKKLWGKK